MAAITLDISFKKDIDWQNSVDSAFGVKQEAVDIWRVEVAENLQSLGNFAGVMSPDEIARAQRYLRKEDHDRFTISRGALRFILSRYIGNEPSAVSFQFERNRKPYVPDADIQYNLSDSGNQILIAINKKPVGIDVEYIKPQFYYDTILPLNFNPAEIGFINETDSSHRFFMLWTRKEAILKATGIGLTDHLKLIPSLDGLHTMDGGLVDTQNNWKLCSFPTAEDHLTTVATDRLVTAYNFYEFNLREFLY